jgi:hypothetical protein
MARRDDAGKEALAKLMLAWFGRGGEVMNCYVYICVVAGVVRYVGKGKGVRIKRHLSGQERNLSDRFHRNLAAAIERGEEVDFYKVVVGLTGDEALALEDHWIGRIGLEQLWNSKRQKPYIAHEEIIERQRAAAKLRWADPDKRVKHKAAMQRRAADPEWRARNREINMRSAADPEWQAKVKAAAQRSAADPEWQAKVKAAAQSLWADPERRVNIAEALQRLLADPEQLAKRKAGVQRLWVDPDHRAKMAARMQRQWADPEFRAKHKAAMQHRARPKIAR